MLKDYSNINIFMIWVPKSILKNCKLANFPIDSFRKLLLYAAGVSIMCRRRSYYKQCKRVSVWCDSMNYLSHVRCCFMIFSNIELSVNSFTQTRICVSSVFLYLSV